MDDLWEGPATFGRSGELLGNELPGSLWIALSSLSSYSERGFSLEVAGAFLGKLWDVRGDKKVWEV